MGVYNLALKLIDGNPCIEISWLDELHVPHFFITRKTIVIFVFLHFEDFHLYEPGYV